MTYKIILSFLFLYISITLFQISMPYIIYYTYQYEIQQVSEPIMYQKTDLITNKWYSLRKENIIYIKIQQAKTYVQIQEIIMMREQYNKIGYNVIGLLIVSSTLLIYTRLQTNSLLYQHEVEKSKLLIKNVMLILFMMLLLYVILSSTIELHKLMIYSDILLYTQKEEINNKDPFYLIMFPLMSIATLFFRMKKHHNISKIQCLIIAIILLWFYNRLGYYIITSVMLIYSIVLIEISITIWIWLIHKWIKRTNC